MIVLIFSLFFLFEGSVVVSSNRSKLAKQHKLAQDPKKAVMMSMAVRTCSQATQDGPSLAVLIEGLKVLQNKVKSFQDSTKTMEEQLKLNIASLQEQNNKNSELKGLLTKRKELDEKRILEAKNISAENNILIKRVEQLTEEEQSLKDLIAKKDINLQLKLNSLIVLMEQLQIEKLRLLESNQRSEREQKDNIKSINAENNILITKREQLSSQIVQLQEESIKNDQVHQAQCLGLAKQLNDLKDQLSQSKKDKSKLTLENSKLFSELQRLKRNFAYARALAESAQGLDKSEIDYSKKCKFAV